MKSKRKGEYVSFANFGICIIYTITCPLKNKVIYIGKTKDFYSRCIGHRMGNNTTNIGRYILFLKENNTLPLIEILDIAVNDKELDELERYWMEQFNQWGFSLLNVALNTKFLKRKLTTLKATPQ